MTTRKSLQPPFRGFTTHDDNSVSSMSSAEETSTYIRRPERKFPSDPGYCYLALVPRQERERMSILGRYPLSVMIANYIVRENLPVADGLFYATEVSVFHFTTNGPTVFRNRNHSNTFSILCSLNGSVGGKKKSKQIGKKKQKKESLFVPHMGSSVSQILLQEMIPYLPHHCFIRLPTGLIPSPGSYELFDWWFTLDKSFHELEIVELELHRRHVRNALTLIEKRIADEESDECEQRDVLVRYLDKVKHHLRTRSTNMVPESVPADIATKIAEKANEVSASKGNRNSLFADSFMALTALGSVGVSAISLWWNFRYNKSPCDKDEILQEITSEENEFLNNPKTSGIDWGSVLADLGGVYLICCSATDVEDLLTRLMGCVILKRRDLQNYFNTIKVQLTDEDVAEQNTMVPESLAGDAAQALQDFRNMKENFAESRLGVFFKSIVAACLCSALTEDDELLRNRLDSLDKVLPGASLKGEDIFDLILNIVTYTAEFIAVAEKSPGEIVGFLFPSTCAQRMAWVTGKIQFFIDGNLEKCGVTPVEFATEVTSLEVDITMTIAAMKKRDKYALRTTTQYHLWYKEILRIKERMANTKYTHNPRERPFCMFIHGQSSIGKSSIIEQIIALFCRSQGISSSEENIWRASDGKYHDGHLQNKEIYVFDDVANAQFNEAEKDKLLIAQLVKFVNNAPYMSMQAEADKKGGISHRPKLILITSNVEDLKCLQITNDAPSLFNRINAYHATVKKEFSNLNGTINSTSCKVTDAVHKLYPMSADFAQLSVSKTKRPDAIRMKHHIEQTRAIEDWQCIWVKQWNEHFRLQTNIVSDMMELKDAKICSHNRLLMHCEECRSKTAEQLASEEDDKSESEMIPHSLSDQARSLTQALYDDTVEWLARLPLPRLHSRIGTFIANLFVRTARESYTAFMQASISKQIACVFFGGAFTVSSAIPFAFLIHQRPVLGTALLTNFFICSFVLMAHVKNIAAQCVVLKVKRGLFGSDSIFVSSLKVLAMMTLCRQVISGFKKTAEMEPQGFFTNSPEENLKPQESLWSKITSSFVPSEKKGTSTLDERFNQVNKHMFRLIADGVDICGVFAINRSVILTAGHAWDGVKDKSEIILQQRGKPTSKEKCKILQVTRPPGTDWAYLHLDRQLQVKITPDILSTDLGHSSLYYPSQDGTWKPRSVTYGTFSNGAQTQLGYQFDDNDSKPGMCITPAISTNQPFKVPCFHMGANHPSEKNQSTVAFALTPQMVYEHLKNTTMMVPHKTRYDETVVPGGKMKQSLDAALLDRRCCVSVEHTTNFEAREKTLTIYGALAEGVKPKSNIQKAFLHPFLPPEINIWGPAVFKRHRDYANNWVKIQNKLNYISPSVIEWAVNDYAQELLSAITPVFQTGNVVTTFSEAVNGDPKDRFFNNIDIKTSGGPGCPKKKEMFWRDDPDSPLQWVPEIESATHQVLNDLLSGTLVLPRVASALKDEIVVREEILGKRKVRVFYIFPTAFLLAGKMLFRRFNSFCCSCPTSSGLMGGMNHTNEDWGELKKLITQFPNCFDSDYTGYDTTQNAQMFMAVKGVLIQVLPFLGYKPHEVQACMLYVDAMRDAPVEYNLALVSFFGVLKSGVWITLLTNGIVNNLLYRIVYKTIKGDDASRFRDNNFLAVQGDDAIFSTQDTMMNPTAVQRGFSSINMKITPGRKDGSFDWKSIEEVVFCKRTFRDILYKDIPYVESPIDMESIWKRMYWKQSDIGLVDHCLANLKPFMLELSRHPPEVYNENVAILRKGLIESSLGDNLPEIPHWDQDYWIDDRLEQMFRDKARDPSRKRSEKECLVAERC
nr:hypothetical protein 1 [Mute swan feces associated picorna-like virus 23]